MTREEFQNQIYKGAIIKKLNTTYEFLGYNECKCTPCKCCKGKLILKDLDDNTVDYYCMTYGDNMIGKFTIFEEFIKEEEFSV